MSWHLEVSREAEKVSLRQDRRQRLRLREAIDELQETPYPLRDRDIQPVQDSQACGACASAAGECSIRWTKRPGLSTWWLCGHGDKPTGDFSVQEG